MADKRSTSEDFDPETGRLEGGRHMLPLRVYYEDTDFSGSVYHANYLRFFERGRTEFLRALGVHQRGLHAEDGLGFVVRSIAVEFLRPARMDDACIVETDMTEARGASMTIIQSLRRQDELLATANVLVACVRGGKPVRLPDILKRSG